jgi:hypothetical protein
VALRDTGAIVGGHFTADARGPVVYAAMRKRAEDHAGLYLEILDSTLVGGGPRRELSRRVSCGRAPHVDDEVDACAHA